MFTYTIREVAVDHITVDYDDGSWAQIPIVGSANKEQIEEAIAAYAPRNDVYASVEDVPFSVGEQNTIRTTSERVDAQNQALIDEQNAEILTYKELRQNNYPTLGDQFDALYWSRNGDTSKLTEIDAKIAQVKTDYPKDMETITRGEYDALIAEASE